MSIPKFDAAFTQAIGDQITANVLDAFKMTPAKQASSVEVVHPLVGLKCVLQQKYENGVFTVGNHDGDVVQFKIVAVPVAHQRGDLSATRAIEAARRDPRDPSSDLLYG
jgi:hypothetical protein